MTELTVELEIACHACHNPIGVKLKCEGAGLKTGGPLPPISVPCQTCGRVNRLTLGPDGTVHAVEPHREPRRFELIWN